MGRNKPRSKAVDVTKSLLQPTSVTDHIAVQISPNTIFQVAEEDLSPTQGSEAAFALRREGKLDTTMKLCLNWRQGNCHNHAACSFAHVMRYFGVTGDVPNPAPTGRTSVFSSTAGGGSYSSVAAGNAGSRGVGGSGGSVAGGHASWSQKMAPPSYSTASNQTFLTNQEERKTVTPTPTAAAATTTTTSSVAPAPTEGPETKAATPPAADASSEATPAARTTTMEPFETPKEATEAPPTPASAAAATPLVHPSFAMTSTGPAVLSAEGLNSILFSLAQSIAAKPPATNSAAAATATTTDAEAEEPPTVKLQPRVFLEKMEATSETLAAPWQDKPCGSVDEIIDTLGKLIIASGFAIDKSITDVYDQMYVRQGPSLLEMVLLRRARLRNESMCNGASGGSPNSKPNAPAVNPTKMPRPLFSTAPTLSRPATSRVGQPGGIGASSGGAHAGGLDDGDQPASGAFYQQLMDFFTSDE